MKTYLIYCEPCGFKKIVEDPDNVGLFKHATSNVQGRIPMLNKKTKKTETFDFVSSMPKYKCPQCGRVVTLKKYNVPKIEPKPDEDKNDKPESDQIQ
jgi:DNA-directed RNA polymerase subunit RPC12/RpoP